MIFLMRDYFNLGVGAPHVFYDLGVGYFYNLKKLKGDISFKKYYFLGATRQL